MLMQVGALLNSMWKLKYVNQYVNGWDIGQSCAEQYVNWSENCVNQYVNLW
jgi:hypothetical protein